MPISLQDSLDKHTGLYKRLEKVIPQKVWQEFVEDIEAIQKLKKEKNAVILAHNYMTPEIFHGVADIVGDSLALAREAAKMESEVIVMAGVQFMAETVKLLNPDSVVLIPDPTAGCSLAESITPEEVRALRKKYPDVPVVTYVNTSAAVKAECDICCTSGNAKKIVESLGVPEVIMVPDEFLALNVATNTDVKIIPWRGRCEVHEKFAADDVQQMRQENPNLSVIAHPECSPEVVAQADFSGSTVGMSEWVAKKKPGKVMLLTEASMSDNLSVDQRGTAFFGPALACPHMKKITLKKIREVLETGVHQVEIPHEIMASARRAVERMIEAS
ncbi:MAG TPA: quinolinate synthase [Rhodospirillaceae bacterium]|nr:quinolinate synthase [Rhodospirillaceae bacterium]